MTARVIAIFAALSAASASAQVTPAPDFASAPVAAGRWTYRPFAGGSIATFDHPSGASQLVVQCAKATRRVTIARAAMTAGSTLYIWTSSADDSLPAQFDQQARRIHVELPAFNSLLDGIAFSRGRFAVSIPGALPLVVPALPEPARVIEDCRI